MKKFKVTLSNDNVIACYADSAEDCLAWVRKEYLKPKVFNGEKEVPTVVRIENAYEYKDVLDEVKFEVEPTLDDLSKYEIHGRVFQEMSNSYEQSGIVMTLLKNERMELSLETVLADDAEWYLILVETNHDEKLPPHVPYKCGRAFDYLSEKHPEFVGDLLKVVDDLTENDVCSKIYQKIQVEV